MCTFFGVVPHWKHFGLKCLLHCPWQLDKILPLMLCSLFLLCGPHNRFLLQLKDLITFSTQKAKRLILLKWKSIVPPTYTIWIKELLYFPSFVFPLLSWSRCPEGWVAGVMLSLVVWLCWFDNGNAVSVHHSILPLPSFPKCSQLDLDHGTMQDGPKEWHYSARGSPLSGGHCELNCWKTKSLPHILKHDRLGGGSMMVWGDTFLEPCTDLHVLCLQCF